MHCMCTEGSKHHENKWISQASLDRARRCADGPAGAFSQEPATSGKAFSQPELIRCLPRLPIYPDALIAQILVAATFPEQVAEADRWLEGTRTLRETHSMAHSIK